MQYHVSSPQEYDALLEDDWRKKRILTIRKMVKKHGPELEEGIDYNMLSFKVNDESIFFLNAQKHYVSFYVGDIENVVKGKDWLRDFDCGKGCIRISKSKEDLSGLECFIVEALRIWRLGGDISYSNAKDL